MNEIIITEYESGQRIDRFLRKFFNEAPPGFVYKMLRKKRIKLNYARADGSEVLKPGDKLKFYLSPETMNKFMSAREVGGSSSGGIDIIYEDDNILAINKPRGVLTHPSGGAVVASKNCHSALDAESQTLNFGKIAGLTRSDERVFRGVPIRFQEDTLIDRCLVYLNSNGVFSVERTSVFTPAFCNRLDRNTSGIVLCGKTPAAMRELNREIVQRNIDRYYLAVTIGKPPKNQELTSNCHKDVTANRVTIVPNGKEMTTGITTIASNGKYSLLSVKLVTGRTHQIRVQLSAIGHPIAGDPKYGGKTPDIAWQLLHAERIYFHGLSGVLKNLNNMELYAPPDRWFTDNIQKLVGTTL